METSRGENKLQGGGTFITGRGDRSSRHSALFGSKTEKGSKKSSGTFTSGQGKLRYEAERVERLRVSLHSGPLGTVADASGLKLIEGQGEKYNNKGERGNIPCVREGKLRIEGVSPNGRGRAAVKKNSSHMQVSWRHGGDRPC